MNKNHSGYFQLLTTELFLTVIWITNKVNPSYDVFEDDDDGKVEVIKTHSMNKRLGIILDLSYNK